MIYILLFTITLCVLLYTILSMILKVPTFSHAKGIRNRKVIKKTISDPFAFLNPLSAPLTRLIPLSLSKRLRLERMFSRAGENRTPQQFIAFLILKFILLSLLAIPFYFIGAVLNNYLGLIFVFFVLIFATYIINNDWLSIKSKARTKQRDIEKEIPRFIEVFAHTVRTDRNVDRIFQIYVNNFDTIFSNELAKTLFDMRTGNQEAALRRFDKRMDDALLSQLIRGILATLRGEDMSRYFDDLIKKCETFRQQRMISFAQATGPKIYKLTSGRSWFSIGVLFVFAAIAFGQFLK